MIHEHPYIFLIPIVAIVYLIKNLKNNLVRVKQSSSNFSHIV